MHKLSRLQGGDHNEHSHAATFKREDHRIVVGVPKGDPEVFTRLLATTEPPYFLLYVLHTPRGEDKAGQYQSPSLTRSQVQDFIGRFKQFLSQDARFDFWAHSPGQNATIVWDRHNLLYAYGPLEEYLRELRALGFSAGAPSVLETHVHHYHSELDAQARDLLSAMEWVWSELRPEDEQ